MKIKGSVFVVTGGASGLGEATVRVVHAQGASVGIFDLNAERGNALAAELGSRAIFAKVNVCSEEDVAKGLADVYEKFGAVHVAVNCAGIGAPCRILSKRGPHTQALFDKVVAINLSGTFNVLRLAAEYMAKNALSEDGERGLIVNTASVAAFEGQIGQAAYGASKGAVVAMTLPAARGLARHAIRVNTIAPGIFATPMLAALPQAARDSLSKQVPFPVRLGQPNEFGRLVAHLTENQYLNATTIRLDGGIRMAAM